MHKCYLLCLLFLLATAFSFAQQRDTKAWDTPQSYPPMVSKGQFLGVIPPLRDLEPQRTLQHPPPAKTWRKRNYFRANERHNPNPQPRGGDPLVPKQGDAPEFTGPELTPGLNFEGLHDDNVTPPDPSGDIGLNHYVQMINTSGGAWFQVWDKQGNSVYGPALTSTIWSQVSNESFGDPIIQYDQDAQRWLMMELQGFFGANELLIAISDNSDPTGSWKAYRFATLGFPDYPKLYVWPDAYFVTLNEITDSNECSGYALDRAALLAGAPEFDIYRFKMPNYLAIQYQPATGADWEGGPPPPPGSPGYIFRVYDDIWDGGVDHLQVWEVHLDWATPSQSHIDGPLVLPTAPFETTVCWSGLFDCIEQPDAAAPRITTLENIIMYRAPYRNFGGHESIVLNHVSDVSGVAGPGGDAAVRWYELRKSGSDPWSIYQQGTYAPDLPTNRFMGTLSMDVNGNIGLGYSVCSDHVNPGLRITGRRNGDPLGQMPIEEYSLIEGGQSHQDERWGDYSNMSVDPVDGRTFWFTGEYQPAGKNWGTRIGTFTVQRDTYDITPAFLTAPVASPFLTNAEPVTVEIFNSGIEPASGVKVSLKVDGNFIATEDLPGTLPSAGSINFTFAATANFSVPGKTYPVEIITHWAPDQFKKNDTLRVNVRKLTANDAALAGRVNFPNLVCSAQQTVGLILQNAAGLPLQSARIRWQLNVQSEKTYDWTGNLAPGARDTVWLPLDSIKENLNFFRAFTSLPNGLDDQDKHNDTMIVKFYGNLDGAYLSIETNTTSGDLLWEVRALNDQLIGSGELNVPGPATFEVCTEDNTCYKLILKAKSINWTGSFRLYDLFGNLLTEAFSANTDEQTIQFCTPQRKPYDVGAFHLLSPKSGGNLSNAETVTISVRNFGLQPAVNPQVAFRFQGGPWHTETYNGTIAPGATASHTFSTTADLSTIGQAYLFDLWATAVGDQAPQNDTAHAIVWNRHPRDLVITNTKVTQACTNASSVVITLTLLNNGLDPVSYFDLDYTVNGVPQSTQTGFVLIPSGDTQEYVFYPSGSTIGSNTLVADLTNVNHEGPDDDPSNDQGAALYTLQPSGVEVNFFIVTDEKPQETSWELLDGQGNTLYSGGPYDQPFANFNQGWCLKADSCYLFRLHDSGGNGMNGFVNAYNSNTGTDLLVFNGGDFGSLQEIDFCVEVSCAGFSINGIVFDPTGGLNNGKIVGQPAGGTEPYQYSLNGVNYQSSPVFSNLAPGTYTLYCRDATGCIATVEVQVGMVATHEPGAGRALLLSPNPVKNLLSIDLPALPGEQLAWAEVLDTKGRQLRKVRLSRWDDRLHGVVSLEKEPAGLYFVLVQVGEKRFGARVVKE